MSKQNFDALGNEIKLTQNDFEFVQRDETIFDRKFETVEKGKTKIETVISEQSQIRYNESMPRERMDRIELIK